MTFRDAVLCQLQNMAHDMILLNVGEDRVLFFQEVFPHVGYHVVHVYSGIQSTLDMPVVSGPRREESACYQGL